MKNETITANANLNSTECVKEAASFGETIYHNLCTGTQTTVQWGSADWTVALILVALGLAFVAVVVTMVIGIARDFFY